MDILEESDRIHTAIDQAEGVVWWDVPEWSRRLSNIWDEVGRVYPERHPAWSLLEWVQCIGFLPRIEGAFVFFAVISSVAESGKWYSYEKVSAPILGFIPHEKTVPVVHTVHPIFQLIVGCAALVAWLRFVHWFKIWFLRTYVYDLTVKRRAWELSKG